MVVCSGTVMGSEWFGRAAAAITNTAASSNGPPSRTYRRLVRCIGTSKQRLEANYLISNNIDIPKPCRCPQVEDHALQLKEPKQSAKTVETINSLGSESISAVSTGQESHHFVKSGNLERWHRPGVLQPLPYGSGGIEE